MDIETTVKIVAAAVAIFGVGRALYDIISGNKLKLRDEYKFARDFFDDLASKTDLHPFAVEKGYHAIAGTTAIKGDEVAYLLTLENPARCLQDYVLSCKYLEHLNTTGDLRIAFAEKYERQWSRSWRKVFYGITYFIFAFGALSPLLLAKPLSLEPQALVYLLAFTVPVLGFIAWISLQSFARIYRGEKLVENQTKHTKRIVLSSTIARPKQDQPGNPRLRSSSDGQLSHSSSAR